MALYDPFAEQYNEMVKAGGPENSYQYIMEHLSGISELQGKKICDIGCGQGELSYRLSLRGAVVTGVDLSIKLLEFAQQKTDKVTWVHDDAMKLSKLPNETFDYVVSSLMLMDLPNHRDVFTASQRILKSEGIMIWVITHPCFQSPFSSPLGDGSRKIKQYDSQFWKSEGKGTIRSTVGAYHRPLSEYLNDFIVSGFSIVQLDEPKRMDNSVDLLPSLLAIVGQKSSNHLS
ncbi:class I SAM-dependent methyltransferase [Paenibacillus lautus]|uniref:class I SAM-dependent methyltransferase n=1 Tax=Paenibacillus lautus TaxID=1401 RepID=UPI003D2ACB3E